MTKSLLEAERIIANMSRAEKAQVLKWISSDLEDDVPGIESTLGVCGGEPCIARTRIPVWVLEQGRRLGTSEAELLRAYPTIRAEDLANAWAYVRSHLAEIDEQIRANEEAQGMARLYSDENFPFPVVEELRRSGHDVLTVAETGKAEQRWPDESVLEFAISDNRCVLTINRRDFIRLHTERPKHAGIIVCTFDNDFSALALRIASAITDGEALPGRLIRINRPAHLS